MKVHTFRLKPGQDLKKELRQFPKDKGIKAGCILNGVGSLTKARLRMPGDKILDFEGPFEIVSITGTVSANVLHIHISISDKDGKVFGGHLRSGCEIHTTAEIAILELEDREFFREVDKETGYRELVVR